MQAGDCLQVVIICTDSHSVSSACCLGRSSVWLEDRLLLDGRATMISTRRRMRSSSARFLGALIGTVLFLLFAVMRGGVGQDPTSNANVIWLATGVLLAGALGAWFFPWLQSRFSVRQMRKKALKDAATGSVRQRRKSSSSR